MALKKVKGNFERMFDKNLTDLVRGIRNNKDNEVTLVNPVFLPVVYSFLSSATYWISVDLLQPKYIAQCMEEIKVELRQDNIAVKANAVAKLTYVSTRVISKNYSL